jgi:L-cysteine S-thiosulfotransferase
MRHLKLQAARPVASLCALALLAPLAVSLNPLAQAQGSTADEIAKYREALQAGNPAELWEARGEDLWKQKRGPKNVSLESCDIGLGPGVVKGAYAVLPKYFADADQVMDLETRLLWCMEKEQGISEAEALKQPFGDGEKRSTFEALVAYIASEAQGVKMAVVLDNPKSREAYALGEKIFHYRGGTHDFACSTCHGSDDKRIRLQDLPNLTTKEGAQKAYTTWPAYRVSQGELRSFQWRLNDCFRQQRFPELKFGSEASIALITFLAYNANGAPVAAPAIKR